MADSHVSANSVNDSPAVDTSPAEPPLRQVNTGHVLSMDSVWKGYQIGMPENESSTDSFGAVRLSDGESVVIRAFPLSENSDLRHYIWDLVKGPSDRFVAGIGKWSRKGSWRYEVTQRPPPTSFAGMAGLPSGESDPGRVICPAVRPSVGSYPPGGTCAFGSAPRKQSTSSKKQDCTWSSGG